MLVAQTRHIRVLSQVFSPDFTGVHIFYEADYVIRAVFTTRILNCSDTVRLWSGLDQTNRNVIRREMELAKVQIDDDPERFLRTYNENLSISG